MTSYIIRRLLAMIPALLGIALITFVLMHATKGGPFASEHANAAVQAAQMRAYHLDEPIWPTFLGPGADSWRLFMLILGIMFLGVGIGAHLRKFRFYEYLRGTLIPAGLLLLVGYLLMITQGPGTSRQTGFVGGQFLRYLGNLVTGNLGESFSHPGQSVNDIIARSAFNSFLLGGAAFIILIGIAVPLGIIAALRQNTWVDYLASGLSLIGYSVPNFVLGIFLILITSLSLHLIPVAAWSVFPRDLLLPALVLAIRPMAVQTRLTRASMIDVMNQDYIRTAWAKGLKSRVVVSRHGLRNALLPVVTVMGDHLGDLITGSLVVESLFAVPGIGEKFVTSVNQRDYGVLMGTTLFYATLVLVINLIVDILYAGIDPRIKLGAAARS